MFRGSIMNRHKWNRHFGLLMEDRNTCGKFPLAITVWHALDTRRHRNTDPVQPERKAATGRQVPSLEEADLLQWLLPGSLKLSMPSSAFQAVG